MPLPSLPPPLSPFLLQLLLRVRIASPRRVVSQNQNLDVPGAFFFSHGTRAFGVLSYSMSPSELESHNRKQYKLWKARPVLYSSAWHQLVCAPRYT